MSKKPVRVDLTFDVAPSASPVRPSPAVVLSHHPARPGAVDAAEAERRAFADTEPAFMDTQPPPRDGA